MTDTTESAPLLSDNQRKALRIIAEHDKASPQSLLDGAVDGIVIAAIQHAPTLARVLVDAGVVRAEWTESILNAGAMAQANVMSQQ